MRNDDVRPYPMIASGDDTRLAHFREHGWLRVPGVFPAEEVAELAEYATARAASQAPDPTNRTATDIGADGRAAPRKLAFPARDDARFRDFALDARLQALLTGLFGGTPLLVMDHVFLKAPEIGGPKYLHQDNFYFHLDPPEAGVSTWIA
ncbi:MAG: phytanoyl-CoA dioxygenase family protein, partial [Gammaproteobacteria bacterium]|nr:phytanoyl-CoA dioxygenase family protein [Gammaproteobacteria bacterium]